MQIKKMKMSIEVLTVVTLVTVSGVAAAADYTGSVRAGVGVSDNIGRSAQSEIDETMATAGFDLGVSTESRTVDLDLDANFDYLDYLDDAFDAEWVGGFNGNATFTLIEERLRWMVQDRFGQQLLDPFQPARPNNREDVNYFSTGPTLNLLTGGRNSVVLDARYDRVDYEDRPADNDRMSGTLSLGRELSRNSTVSVNFSGRRVDYDESEVAPPYEGYSSYVSFATKGSQNSLKVDLGYNEVEYAGKDSDGILASISWTRTTSANGRLTVSGGSRYSDQGDIFRLLDSVSYRPGDTFDVSDSSAPFLNNHLTLRYSIDHERYSLAAGLNFNQEDYDGGVDLDRDLFGAALNLRREVTRTVFAGARLDFQRRDYKYQGRQDDDLTLGLLAGYRFGTGFDASLEYQHFQRNSIVARADFTENRAFVRVSYTPRWSR
jgi:hypothetical protein